MFVIKGGLSEKSRHNNGCWFQHLISCEEGLGKLEFGRFVTKTLPLKVWLYFHQRKT